MKKWLTITCMIVIFICGFWSQTTYAASVAKPPKGSTEELIQDTLITMLLPHMDQPIQNFYSEKFKETPIVYPYEVDILKANRVHGYRSFSFLITLQVTPMIGAHNPVGKDQMTFYVAPSVVKLKRFHHLKSYPTPEN